ncbi:MAG: alpha/beta hydrolase [Acidimicrobiia bacterium]|nr:alpha/beta hydrolase [Acidimicrobiia bacterium]
MGRPQCAASDGAALTARAASVGMLLAFVLLVGCVGGGPAGRATSGSSARSTADAAAVGNSAGGSSPASDEAPEPIEFTPTFDEGSCPPDFPGQLAPRCGTVDVPSDWSTGEGTVTLAVAVFPSTAADPAPDPVVYLEGGPGGHALETLVYSADTLVVPLLERSDVVVFDQRGAGLSEPRLACPEVTEATREVEDIPITDNAEAERRYLDALGACHDRLVSSGTDLADFNSFNNAHDTDAIRRALGYEQWNLFGISYGTKLGLESMRQHPGGIRAAVLDSVYPPEVDSVAENPLTFIASYERVAGACEAEPACAAQGDLIDRLAGLAVDLQADPVKVEISDYVSGDRDDMYLTGDALVGIVTQALYSPSWFTDLPELASDLEAGRTGVAGQFLSQQRTLERYVSEGMFYAFSCHEEIRFSDPAAVVDPPDPFGLRETFDLASNTGSNAFESCAVFDSGRAVAEADEQVVSDIPALLLAGVFDPVTPVSWAERAAEGLSRSHLVVAPHASHGVSGSECGMSVVVAFLDDPTVAPDAACFDGDEPRFIGPAAEELELVEVTYVVEPWGTRVTTVRPESWVVGSLAGDQYRQDSFLDPTQLFQLAGDSSLGFSLEVFIEQQWGIALTDAGLGVDAPPVGGFPIDQIGSRWTRRIGAGDDVVVEWFESEVEENSGTMVYVILVSSPSEQEKLVDQVLVPALRAITVE